jgi:integrase
MPKSKTPAPAKSRGNAGDLNRQKTLEDIMGSVERSPNLREHQRRSMLSALRAVARCLGKPPAEITAQPAALQKELATANYLQAGITKKRWTNVRSLTLGALRIAGAKIMPSRWERSKFSHAWSELRRGCPSQRYLIGLSRFMNHCSNIGIEPGDVDAAVFANFRQEMEKQSLVRNPAIVYGRICRLWDQASATIDGWPAFKAGAPAAVRGYSLEWSTFLQSFRDDVEAFLTQKAERNIFSDKYVRPVKPATTLGRRKMLRQMATALTVSGVPAAEITSLSTLVQPKHAEAILLFFIDRAGEQLKESIYTHACLLRTIARHWVKNVEHSELDAAARNIARELKKNQGMKHRNRVRLRQFNNPRNEEALLDLPARLMRLARQEDIGGKASMQLATYAVAIEILTIQPMRIKNLVGLDLERNVIISKDKRYNRVFLSVDGEDVKNGVAIDRELSPSTSAMIRTYLEEFRPRISATPSKWLFPNPSGQQRNIVGFGAQMSTMIKRHTGLDVHPHLFRALAVRFIEQDDQGAMEVARRLLGHRHIETTIRSYSEGDNTAAQKHYGNLIDSKRAKPKNVDRPGTAS